MKKVNKNGFSLPELIVAITIMITLSVVWFSIFSWGGKADDIVSWDSLWKVSVILEDFKPTFWSYPASSSQGRNYPKEWCSVSGYESLMSCLVAKKYLVEWSPDYEKIAFDRKENNRNDSGEEFNFYYWVNEFGNKYKLCALARVQSNEKLKGLDGNDTTEGKRYICITSSGTKESDITNMNK
jgi:prepilin-type N-terminal cleavage/methylation domain-containing protein